MISFFCFVPRRSSFFHPVSLSTCLMRLLEKPAHLSFDCKISGNAKRVNSVETSFCISGSRILFRKSPISLCDAPKPGFTTRPEFLRSSPHAFHSRSMIMQWGKEKGPQGTAELEQPFPARTKKNPARAGQADKPDFIGPNKESLLKILSGGKDGPKRPKLPEGLEKRAGQINRPLSSAIVKGGA